MSSVAVLLLLPSLTSSCGSFGRREGEPITDPTFSFSVSPPVRWTYFPPVQPIVGTSIANYFPGQSASSSEAQQAAQNEVLAAYLEALSSSFVPTTDMRTTVTYSPDEVSNCYVGQAIPPGTRIGYLAGGAITQVALVQGTGGAGVTVTQCPLSQTSSAQQGVGPYMDYVKQVTVATRSGVTLSKYEWERVASEMQSILNFRYHTLFRSKVEIN
ncbi:unnamed protein product [Caenorhabditis auriculariae]|uniref:Uncharacterized protein n=1 Tax=Caenorhabditis auriculariae TaxID=2777116 RepID=A0A8S1GVK4_9PELO|nr:unnamed protein product [Caenorhabditis auriculariae]